MISRPSPQRSTPTCSGCTSGTAASPAVDVANDRGVRSIRYHFSNRSDDIHGIFTAALDTLGIHWTRSTKYIVSIYRKADTARLDRFIGPKAIAVPWNDAHYTA
jgi:hypothetical protein